MSAEAAALRLGTTVANTAAQMWLGGKRREQERRLPMDELVRVRVPGLRLQRSVRRQFEEMADAVAARMEPFLAHEFRGMDESGREAAVNGVCDTFAAADLSDEAVLAADASPAELIRRITGTVRAPVGLNEAEERFYRLLFTECCQYYVSIVRSLPVFEERALAELLERTTSLGTDVARVLERLPDRSLFAPDGTDQDMDFRRLYMDLVSNDLDEVELFRRTSDRAAAQVRLSVAYVSLRATGDAGTRRRAAGRSLPLLRPDMSDWEEPGTESSGMRVEAALGGASRVLLRGEAGSGKTTLLRWLAITAARGAFTAELADWNGLTPVFVKLREYSGRPLPKKPEELLDGVAGTITGIMPKGWVERQLRDGTVLLLVDGVDELLGGERRSVREWLRKLLGTYSGIRVVVTSRPTAAGVDWLRREDFTALHMDRMTPPDLAAFVRRWHQAVRELGDELPCAVDELPRYEQSLLNSLKDRPHLPSLAGTPLLAAMLCAMHLNRGSQLPRDRMELYKNALDTLVHDRDTERSVPSAVDSKLSLGDKLVILRDLAWRLSDNNRSEISVDQAAVHVGRKLAAMRHLDVQDGHGVLDQLLERSGILRDPVQGRLDFVHRTFQEYLAAEEATEEDRIGNLVGRAHLDLWRETIIMAAGHANTRQREELLGGILDRAEREPRHARALRLLAAACQETMPSASAELAGRLDEAVSALLPARRKTDPPALAAVGTSLLRRLPRSLGELTEKAAAQTVRTVAMIGGEEALSLMAGYAEDERDGVIDELIGAWRYFDADAYADQVLAPLPLTGHTVELTHSGQWHAATRLRSITDLWIGYPFPDLAAVAQLSPLTELSIPQLRGAGDLSVMAAHPGLRELAVLGPRELINLETVGNLGSLAHLFLGLRGTPTLDGLRLRPAASELSFYDVSESTDLGVLSSCCEPWFLYLAGLNTCMPRSINAISAMRGLRHLSIKRFDLCAWLKANESLPPALRTLNITNCVLPDGSDAYRHLGGSLKSVRISSCHTPDGQPITTLDLPDVDVTIT
ncbi:NACHT domain-containing protein [Streptomyces sp. HC44]|uniref:NACHT domain-containing protein n=1 Tax=Streptomyces scabichelini TaxID=2711217 RepID=A0A6G4V3Z7_9ACTN|nr:NACHT domain-containing protein [Streptomyces scabichelini]NGO08597.1 NACHT domain-containing protein [Streptomyces scabichelini]